MAGEGVQDVVKRVLVSPAEGWDGWVMRLFDIAPGGHTPRHAHDWPHINFIAAGPRQLHLDGEDYALEAGSYAYVPAGLVHQFSAHRRRGRSRSSASCPSTATADERRGAGGGRRRCAAARALKTRAEQH